MKKRYDLDKFVEETDVAINDVIAKTEYPSHFYKAFYEGERKYYQSFDVESKEYDLGWIRTIESYFPSIDSITRNLKSVLKYEEEIIPVEKAKKVTKQSVTFLTANTHLINDITEEGVIPKKILTDQSEIDYGIYENRFVMTLIKRLNRFVSDRVSEIRKDKEGFRKTHLNLASNFVFEDATYEVNVDVTQKETYNKRKTQEHNDMVLERAERLEYLIGRLNNSKFMLSMKDKKDVKPPILKTSILTKNPDYKNAYLLWLYLDRHSKLEYKLEKETTKKRFTSEYNQALDRNIMMLTSSLINYDKVDNPDLNTVGKAKYKVTKPQNITVLPGEIETTLQPIQIENNIISEFYLNKTKEIFKTRIDEILQENNNKYKISLEQALRETLEVGNSLYASFFEINQDVDVFQRLIKEDDPQKSLEEAYEKFSVASIVRSVKEKDFKEALKLEKKWVQVLKEKQEALIAYEQEQSDARVALEVAKNKEIAASNKQKLVNKSAVQINKYIVTQKKSNDEEIKALKEELKRARIELKAKEKQRIKQEREKLRKKLRLQKQVEQKRVKEEKKKFLEKQKKDKEKIKKEIRFVHKQKDLIRLDSESHDE